MQGLRRVRRFRRCTNWIRSPAALIVILINNLLSACKLRSTGKRNVLVWSKKSRNKPRIAQSIVRLTTDAQHMPFREALSYSEVSSPVSTVRKEVLGSVQEGGGDEGGTHRCSCAQSLRDEATHQRPRMETQEPPCQCHSRRSWDEEKGELPGNRRK